MHVSFGGAISGSGSVTKLGGDALTLTGANTYSGGTMLKGGQINVGHSTALGSGTLAMDEGTTLGFASDGLNLANAVVLTGTSDPVIDTGTFTETLSGVISGGGALTKNGSGTLVLAGANTYTGATAVAAGTLRAGAANAFSAASSHTVAAGATLDTGGFNQRVAALANSGTVSLVGANAGSTLTVTGAYVGNAGVLRLGTGLPASDRLVIDGAAATASGTTSVQIATLGGLGALTTGNGIEVISARNGATTTAQTTRSAFSLAGGHVDAGAFEYRLHAADAQGAGENWYLRSTTTVVPPVIPPVTPPVPPGEIPTPCSPRRPPRPPRSHPFKCRPTGPKCPCWRPCRGSCARPTWRCWATCIGAWATKRPGSWGGPATQAPSSLAEAGTRRAWGRLVYSDLDVEQPGVAQARTDLRVSGLQAGTDLLVMDGWRAGVYVGYLDGNADVSGNARGVTAECRQQRPALALPGRLRDLDGCQRLVRRQRAAGRQPSLRDAAGRQPPRLGQGQRLHGLGGRRQGVCADRALEHRAAGATGLAAQQLRRPAPRRRARAAGLGQRLDRPAGRAHQGRPGHRRRAAAALWAPELLPRELRRRCGPLHRPGGIDRHRQRGQLQRRRSRRRRDPGADAGGEPVRRNRPPCGTSAAMPA